MIGQVFAGAGLGALVGVLVGLSSSPVVSVVIGALATAMTTLLSFSGTGKSADTAQTAGSLLRLGSFGITCSAALILGLLIRTHNWASPSIAKQVAEVMQAGYSQEEARAWVAYRNTGTTSVVTPPAAPPTPTNGTHDALSTSTTPAPVAGSVLFSGTDSGECQHFDSNRYKDTKELLNALQQQGGKYAEYAKKISAVDTERQKTVLASLQFLFCPQ